MNRKSFVSIVLLGSVLGGCTTFGTNINGSFRCDAPDGVCAPSTVIDDNAIARIEETSSTDLLNPAGPYQMDDGIDAPVHNLAALEAPAVARPAPSYQLSVVFPGYTDASGTAHARKVVQTEAALPGRGDAMETMAMRGRRPARNQGLLAAAESAPPYLAIAPEVLTSPLPPSVSESPVAVAEANALNPIEEIEAKVSERLSAQQQARRQAASFPGTVE
ncbi:MAG: hypothetical protein AAF683_00335 [Pseudomonadota bacterium]